MSAINVETIEQLISHAKHGLKDVQLFHPQEIETPKLIEFAKATNESQTLENLGFFRCSFTIEQLKTLCVGLNPNIRHLLFQFCHLGDQGSLHIAEILKKPSCKLHRLIISDDTLGDLGVDYLAKALEINTSLKLLYLTDNRITDTGCQSLLQMLQVNSSLEQIKLAGNSEVSENMNAKLASTCSLVSLRKDWQRILTLCQVSIHRLSRKANIQAFPTEIYRKIKEMLCG